MIFVVMVSTYRDSFFVFNNACAVGLSDATGTSVGLARFPVAAPTQSIDTINTCANANLMVSAACSEAADKHEDYLQPPVPRISRMA